MNPVYFFSMFNFNYNSHASVDPTTSGIVVYQHHLGADFDSKIFLSRERLLTEVADDLSFIGREFAGEFVKMLFVDNVCQAVCCCEMDEKLILGGMKLGYKPPVDCLKIFVSEAVGTDCVENTDEALIRLPIYGIKLYPYSLESGERTGVKKVGTGVVITECSFLTLCDNRRKLMKVSDENHPDATKR